MTIVEIIRDLESHVAKFGGEEITEKVNTLNLLAALKLVENLRVAAKEIVEAVDAGIYTSGLGSWSKVLGRLRDAVGRLISAPPAWDGRPLIRTDFLENKWYSS